MNTLPFNLFDCLLGVTLVGGLLRGRQHGLSKDLLSLVKWLVLVIGCAALYKPASSIVAQSGTFDPVSSCVLAYLGVALAIFLLFARLEDKLGPRLESSNVFGRGEYYLGMGSGMLRFACILLMALALLNARSSSPVELQSIVQVQELNYRGQVIPNLYSLQVAVFQRSLSGPWIHRYLGFLLIETPGPTLDQIQAAQAKAARTSDPDKP